MGLILLIILDISTEVFTNFYIRIISLYNEYQVDNNENRAFFLLGMMIMGLMINNALKYLLNTFMVQTTT